MNCTVWICHVCGKQNHILDDNCKNCNYPYGTTTKDELQKEIVRCPHLTRKSQRMIMAKTGKDIFMDYMKMTFQEIEDLPQEDWERIKKVLRETDEKTRLAWIEEYGERASG